jgi:hypothetical protein
MPKIIEGSLEFDFKASIQALKYDDTDWMRSRFGNYPAMDILAREQGQQWWIEIKDCEGEEPANRPRLSAAEPAELVQTRHWIEAQSLDSKVRVTRKKPHIIDELVEKLRSTLIGCELAGIRDSLGKQVDSVVGTHRLIDGDSPLIVVLYLTWEGNEFGRLARGLQTKLDKALRHYGWRGFIVNNSSQLTQTGLTCQVVRSSR